MIVLALDSRPLTLDQLLFLFRVQRVLAQARAVLLELQLLAAHLAPQRVIVIAGFLANEKHGFDFLFALTLSHGRGKSSGFRVRGSVKTSFPRSAWERTTATLRVASPRL
jgi:hypothetical protein